VSLNNVLKIEDDYKCPQIQNPKFCGKKVTFAWYIVIHTTTLLHNCPWVGVEMLNVSFQSILWKTSQVTHKFQWTPWFHIRIWHTDKTFPTLFTCQHRQS